MSKTIRELSKYEAACKAISDARTADEIAAIRDESIRQAALSRVASNAQPEADATEIRIRAERALAKLLEGAPKHKGGRPASRPETGGQNPPVSKPPSYRDLGIDKDEAKRIRHLAKIKDDEFESEIAKARDKAAKGKKMPLDLFRTKRMKQQRAEKERELAPKSKAAARKIGHSVYNVILADPPWRFYGSSPERAIERHYATMTLDEIKALSAKLPCADDCVLFLWATVPCLDQAIDTMVAWGFRYTSHFIWVKNKIGTGYWNRNKHELLLVGTRGKPPAPAQGEQPDSVFEAPVGKHSEKPAASYEIIERMFPTAPKLEMFARRARDGWDLWGNEAPNTEEFDI